MKRVLQTCGAIAASMSYAVSPACAAPTVAFFMEALDEGGTKAEVTETVLHAYAEGHGWSNTMLEMRGQSPLFCPPRGLGLVSAQHVNIFKRYVASVPQSETEDAAMIMLYALQQAFPCEE